jgi:hypothetical protein
MKAIIFTQVYENYGTETDAHWKAKGGDEYVVRNVANEEDATITVMGVRSQIEQSNDFVRETIINWKLVDDNYLTEFERSQLEYEGKIDFPAKEIIWA